jgi:methionyl-tRNA formyltransferase
MKIIFFGTPEFAAEALKTLVKEKIGKVILAVTQPDRPVGRKQTVVPTPVKVYASSQDIAVFQPEDLHANAINEIVKHKADVGVVVAYGNLIPKILIDSFSKGIVNIHPSLLPKHRGATPVAAAILAGDKETGVSLMLIDEHLDHGPVIAQRKFELKGDETSDGLLEALAPVAHDLLKNELVGYLNDEIKSIAQEDAKATFCSTITDEDARIDWTKDVVEIERIVRAMHGHIPAWSKLSGTDKKILVHRARILKGEHDLKPGILTEHDNALAVSVKGGYLLVDEVQLSGGNLMPGASFLNGNRKLIGTTLA